MTGVFCQGQKYGVKGTEYSKNIGGWITRQSRTFRQRYYYLLSLRRTRRRRVRDVGVRRYLHVHSTKYVYYDISIPVYQIP